MATSSIAHCTSGDGDDAGIPPMIQTHVSPGVVAELGRALSLLRKEGLLATVSELTEPGRRFVTAEAYAALVRSDGDADWWLVEPVLGPDPLRGFASALVRTGLLDGCVKGLSDPAQMLSDKVLDWLALEMTRNPDFLEKATRLGLRRRLERQPGGRPVRLLVVFAPFAASPHGAEPAYQESLALMLDRLLHARAELGLSLTLALVLQPHDLGRCARNPKLVAAVNRGFLLLPEPGETLETQQSAPYVDVHVERAVAAAAAAVESANRARREAAERARVLRDAACSETAPTVGQAASANELGAKARPAQDGALPDLAELARFAEEVFGHLVTPERVLAERLFRALVRRNPLDDEPARYESAPARLGDVAGWLGLHDWQALTPVIDRFVSGAERILACEFPPRDDSIVALSHTGLIAEWARLRGWADDEQARLEAYLFACERARRINEGGDGPVLLSSEELRRAQRIFKTSNPDAVMQSPDPSWAWRYADLTDGVVYAEVMTLITASNRAFNAHLNAILARSRMAPPSDAHSAGEAASADSYGHGPVPTVLNGESAGATAVEAVSGTATVEPAPEPAETGAGVPLEGHLAQAAGVAESGEARAFDVATGAHSPLIEVEEVETTVRFGAFARLGKAEVETPVPPEIEVQRQASRIDLARGPGALQKTEGAGSIHAAREAILKAAEMPWARGEAVAQGRQIQGHRVALWTIGIAATVALVLLMGDVTGLPVAVQGFFTRR